MSGGFEASPIPERFFQATELDEAAVILGDETRTRRTHGGSTATPARASRMNAATGKRPMHFVEWISTGRNTLPSGFLNYSQSTMAL